MSIHIRDQEGWRPKACRYVLTADAMRSADLYTGDCLGIPSIVLMEKAALAVAAEAEDCAAAAGAEGFLVFSGKGNNGADGLAAGRLLLDKGYRVGFYAPGEILKGSLFEIQASILRNMGREILPFPEEEALTDNGFERVVVIDALCGIGLRGPLRPEIRKIVRLINHLKERGCPVVSVDIPSGVDTDTGAVMDEAVRADRTVTFGYAKRGHYFFPGAVCCGKLTIADIGIYLHDLCRDDLFWTLDPEKGAGALELTPRDESGNKKTFGRVLVFGGAAGMAGAAVFAASAALRAGAGMVRIVAEEENREIVQTLLPEALFSAYSRNDERIPEEEKLASWADAFIMGPGMGRTEKAGKRLSSLLAAALKGKRPVILDADALHMISGDSPCVRILSEREDQIPLILTPHPGELAALCGMKPEDVKKDILSAARNAADRYQAAVAAKDARTLVVMPSDGAARAPVYLNLSGNSALSTAGSGDVLSGLTAAFALSEKDPYKAAVSAVFVHGLAGRKCASVCGEGGVLASELPVAAAEVLNERQESVNGQQFQRK